MNLQKLHGQPKNVVKAQNFSNLRVILFYSEIMFNFHFIILQHLQSIYVNFIINIYIQIGVIPERAEGERGECPHLNVPRASPKASEVYQLKIFTNLQVKHKIPNLQNFKLPNSHESIKLPNSHESTKTSWIKSVKSELKISYSTRIIIMDPSRTWLQNSSPIRLRVLTINEMDQKVEHESVIEYNLDFGEFKMSLIQNWDAKGLKPLYFVTKEAVVSFYSDVIYNCLFTDDYTCMILIDPDLNDTETWVSQAEKFRKSQSFVNEDPNPDPNSDQPRDKLMDLVDHHAPMMHIYLTMPQRQAVEERRKAFNEDKTILSHWYYEEK